MEMRRFSTKSRSIKIGYVDIHHDGELLKETFDIETIPAIRIIAEDKVYHLKWV